MSSRLAPRPTIALFDLLDEALAANPGPTGFSGSVALAVRFEDHVAWWGLRSDGLTAETRRSTKRPFVTDFTLLVDADTAGQLAGLPAVPDHRRLLLRQGDLTVMAKFTRRFLRRLAPHQIRVSPIPGQKRRPRRRRAL